MNQQKLKMLIKFDKIKFLEDFYNFHKIGSGEEIHLDAEVDNSEMIKASELVYKGYCKKIYFQERRKLWAMKGVEAILSKLIFKRNQTNESKQRYSLHFWKVKVME